jgi:HAD superfamily hydrolase (TIGR01509 family)
MPELSALLFDVDGTLAETEEVHRKAFNQAFEQADLDWNWSPALYGQLLAVTGGKERIRYYIERGGAACPAVDDLTAFIAGVHRDKTRIYTQLVSTGQMPLRPGVRRLLVEARAEGLRLAIATTTSPENVVALLRASLAPDAESWFEVIGAGGVVSHKKPAPDIYEHTLAQLSLSAQACLAVEDSENGLRSARHAAVPTVVTLSDYTRDQDFSDAILVVDHLGEPGKPFSVISGDAGDSEFVDVALLRRLHHAASSQEAVGRRSS